MMLLQVSVSIASGRSLIQCFELFFEFIKRDLKSKYKNTFLGLLWIILQPLFLAILLVFFTNNFASKLFPYKSDYLSMFALLIPWYFFSTSFVRASYSIESNNHLIYRSKFPVILLPLSVIFAAFIDVVVNSFIFFLFVLFLKKVIFIEIIYLMLIILVGSIFICALGIFFSILICFASDLRHLIPFLIQLSLFGLPILFNESSLPVHLRPIYENIPFVWMISRTKELVAGSIDFSFANLANVLLISLIFLLLAYFLFKKLERYAVDYI